MLSLSPHTAFVSHTASANGTTMERTDGLIHAALSHRCILLRFKNRLTSPLLQLPAEIIVFILSLVNGGRYVDWQPIFGTCHYISQLMRDSTTVWWKVHFDRTISSLRAAHVAFQRSSGYPWELVTDLGCGLGAPSNQAGAISILSRWENGQVFQVTQLQTLVFTGAPSAFSHFSWVFGGSLPNLKHLKVIIHTSISWPVQIDYMGPVPLNIPADTPLETLDLYDIALSWSPRHPTALRELRLAFGYWPIDQIMPEEDLLRILDASSQLEHLSLGSVRIGDNQQGPPNRIARLPNLKTINLFCDAKSVIRLLVRVDVPACSTLDVNLPRRADQDGRELLNFIVRHARVSEGLLAYPPLIRVAGNRRFRLPTDPLHDWSLHIGSLDICLTTTDLPEVAVKTLLPLISSPVEHIQISELDLDKQDWMELLQTHCEVRWIECSQCGFGSLSDALLPMEGDGHQVVPCQSLQSIRLEHCDKKDLASLFKSLEGRRNAGFKLWGLQLVYRDPQGVWSEVEAFHSVVEQLDVRQGYSFGHEVSYIPAPTTSPP